MSFSKLKLILKIFLSAGKLSAPSPVLTRSARKKKNELNATIGTPKAVTPTKALNGKNLNSKTTPKTQKSTPGTKGGKKSSSKEEEFKLELEDEEDSDDLDSDDMGNDKDSDDVDSDDEILGKIRHA